jgi:GAF domain-containing protein
VTTNSSLIEKAGLSNYGLVDRINRICSAVVTLTHADQAGVGMVDRDILRHIGTSPPNDLLTRMSLPVKESPAYLVIGRGKDLVINNLRDLTTPEGKNWAKYAKSYVGVPIRFEGIPVACLGAYTLHSVHYWTSVEVTVMEGIAKMVEANFPLSPDDVAELRAETS